MTRASAPPRTAALVDLYVRKLCYLAALIAAMLIPAAPASASAVTPGSFCAQADAGATRPATGGTLYVCQNSGGRYHWIPADPRGGDGYSPTPTAAVPSSSPSPEPRPSTPATTPPASPGATRTPDTAATPGQLPRTGYGTAPAAAGGAALTAAGLALLFAARRRRARSSSGIA